MVSIGVWYLATVYIILLLNIILMRLVPGPPGVVVEDHSYCCDFGKSLLNITTRF